MADIQRKAAATDKALGIVRIKDQFATRCKREFADQMRLVLLPEAAFVASDAITQDEDLWIMKNVPVDVGKEGLEKVLEQSLWDGHVIRAQGHDRWIVAAKHAPPSQHVSVNQHMVLIEPLKHPNAWPVCDIGGKASES